MTMVTIDHGHLRHRLSGVNAVRQGLSHMADRVSTQVPIQNSRRERQRADRRRRLFEAALGLFVEKGFDSVTVDEIAAAADLAKGTFFNYFPTKLHVLAVYHAQLAGEISALGHSVRGPSAREMFKQLFHGAARIVRREGALVDVLVKQVFTHPQLMALDQDLAPDMLQLYCRFVRAGVESGELRADLNSELVATVIGDIWTGTIVEWVYGGKGFSLPKKLLQKLDLLFDGLCRSNVKH
jgi:TetR/AcrR family transcriptional regulator, cholesterol catabolism regulator